MIFFKIANKIEKLAAKIQGKGYGANSIAQEVSLVLNLLGKKPKIAIDIGGNIGLYSIELLKQTQPSLEIHIFEPSPVAFKSLMKKFKKNKQVNVAPYALSNKAQNATLYFDYPGSGLASLTKRSLDHFSIAFNGRETIKTMRFETFWKGTLNKAPIDIVKIDVEGHELDVLKGFGSAILNIKIIQFEFGGCNIDTGTFFKNFWDFFKARNFDLYRITPLGIEKITSYEESHEFFSTTNYIAKSNN